MWDFYCVALQKQCITSWWHFPWPHGRLVGKLFFLYWDSISLVCWGLILRSFLLLKLPSKIIGRRYGWSLLGAEKLIHFSLLCVWMGGGLNSSWFFEATNSRFCGELTMILHSSWFSITKPNTLLVCLPAMENPLFFFFFVNRTLQFCFLLIFVWKEIFV